MTSLKDSPTYMFVCKVKGYTKSRNTRIKFIGHDKHILYELIQVPNTHTKSEYDWMQSFRQNAS